MTQHEPMTPDEETVRRALADLRHTAEMPVEVARRLDRVLVDLSVERASASAADSAPVVALAERRSRRGRWAAGLVAAAAAIVAIASAPTWWPTTDSGPVATQQRSEPPAAAPDTAQAPAPLERAAPESVPSTAQGSGDVDEGTPGAASPTAPRTGTASGTASSAPELHSGPALTHQVRALLGQTGSASETHESTCRPSRSRGPEVERAMAVRLDGHEAWLVQQRVGFGSVALVVDCQDQVLEQFRLD